MNLQITGLILLLSSLLMQGAEVKLLNVSFDVTREFYADVNARFAARWKASTGDSLTINQSHGGSSKQARSVIDGLEADVVTMNQSIDIDILHERGGLIPAGWASRLPHNSAPNTSTILILVRKGNPRGIRDWEDLAKPGVSVVIPNPKTSGNGRYSYLAAWGYAWKRSAGNREASEEFVRRLFRNVPVLDTGGRGAATTFAQREIGDALLTFESDIHLTRKEFGADKFDVVVPSSSILAENPVVWVDKVVEKRGTTAVARAYLDFLFSDEGQELAAKHHFRPVNPTILAKYYDRFTSLSLFAVGEIFGSWKEAQQTHFADGGTFDRIFSKGAKQ